MPHFELNDNHLEMLKNECDGKKKINLNTLKAITKYYHTNYPSSFDYSFIIKTSKENIRNKFIELLCKNYDKLYLLIHPNENKKDLIKYVSSEK